MDAMMESERKETRDLPTYLPTYGGLRGPGGRPVTGTSM